MAWGVGSFLPIRFFSYSWPVPKALRPPRDYRNVSEWIHTLVHTGHREESHSVISIHFRYSTQIFPSRLLFGENTFEAAHFALVRSTIFISNIFSVSDFPKFRALSPERYGSLEVSLFCRGINSTQGSGILILSEWPSHLSSNASVFFNNMFPLSLNVSSIWIFCCKM